MVGDGRTLPDTDLISGSSGIVIALLSVHRRAAHDGLVGACRAICEQLIGIRQPKLVGCGWPASDAAPDAPPLCGLGHGASGSAWALAETAWATGDRHLLGVAREALRYERGWFSSERCAWPDLRLAAAESAGAENWPGWTTAWCHGAIGIGAVRLRLFEIGHEMNALAEASAAIQAARSLAVQAGAALAQGVASDVTLCHGLGGAIELALLAAEVLELEDHLRAARRIGDLCLNIHRLNGQRWTCGLRNADKVPGLFLGLAGIGVTMMRLHDPTLIGTPMLAGRLPRPRRAGPHGPATP